MSTRAIYTIVGDQEPMVHIYIHHDGYPTGAFDHISAALPYAWQLPRFEPDEFAAALCAGNKGYYITRELKKLREFETLVTGVGPARALASDEGVALKKDIGYCREMQRDGYCGGGVRVFESKPLDQLHTMASDIEYRYEIRCLDGKLHVKCFETHYWKVANAISPENEKEVFSGALSAFGKWAKAKEEEEASA